MAKKKARKGFKRSAKEWEETIAGHIGKFIDRADWTKLAAIGTGTFVCYELGKLAYEQQIERTLFAGSFGLIGLGIDLLARKISPPERRKIPDEMQIPLVTFSFFTSYMMVEHGTEAMSLIAKSIQAL